MTTFYADLVAVEALSDSFAAPTFHTFYAYMASVEDTSDSFLGAAQHRRYCDLAAVEPGSDSFNAYILQGKSLSSVAIQVQNTASKKLSAANIQNVAINSTCSSSKRGEKASTYQIGILVTVQSLVNHGTTAGAGIAINTSVGVRHCRLTPSYLRASLKEAGQDVVLVHASLAG
jgi:hypothetical protein